MTESIDSTGREDAVVQEMCKRHGGIAISVQPHPGRFVRLTDLGKTAKAFADLLAAVSKEHGLKGGSWAVCGIGMRDDGSVDLIAKWQEA